MRKLTAGLCIGITVSCLSIFGQDDKNAEKIARGKYLAEEVAKCQSCHTPHLINGEFVKSAWMKGTTIDFVLVNPTPNWHTRTPDITSTSQLWSRWGEDGMVKFLETGKNPRGNAADPPMPAYTLSHEDAVAVSAYLRSLK